MTEQDNTVEEKIIGLIAQLNAYIEQYHGGSVELDRIDGNAVYVRLGGACEIALFSCHPPRLGRRHLAAVLPGY